MHGIKRILKHVQVICRPDGENEWLWGTIVVGHIVTVKVTQGTKQNFILAVILFAQEKRMFSQFEVSF